jgi:hypothetical protein
MLFLTVLSLYNKNICIFVHETMQRFGIFFIIYINSVINLKFIFYEKEKSFFIACNLCDCMGWVYPHELRIKKLKINERK